MLHTAVRELVGGLDVAEVIAPQNLLRPLGVGVLCTVRVASRLFKCEGYNPAPPSQL